MARDIQAAWADLQKRLTQPPPIPGMDAFRGPKKRTGPIAEAPPMAPEGRPKVGERIDMRRPSWASQAAEYLRTQRSAKPRKKV